MSEFVDNLDIVRKALSVKPQPMYAQIHTQNLILLDIAESLRKISNYAVAKYNQEIL
jgi:hypothetical protein